MRTLALLWLLAAPQAPAPGPGAAPTAPAPVAAPATAPDAASVVRGIQAFYQQSADMRADFTQTYTYRVYDRRQVSNGTVFFKKPGKMRWDYKSPVPKVFVADGQVLWAYEPQENQAFKRPLGKAQLPVALTFMSGKGRLEDEFDSKLLTAPDAASYLVELIPRKSEGDYKSLRLLVDKQTYAVKASTVVDPVGNTNHLVFSNVKTNVGLPDKGFSFTPPAGVRIVDDPRGTDR